MGYDLRFTFSKFEAEKEVKERILARPTKRLLSFGVEEPGFPSSKDGRSRERLQNSTGFTHAISRNNVTFVNRQIFGIRVETKENSPLIADDYHPKRPRNVAIIKMRVSLLILFAVIATATAENDESWTWNNDKQKTSRAADVRYRVHEPPEHLNSFNNGVQLGFRPQNPGPYGPNGRPLVPAYQGNNGVLVGPGGPTGIIGRPPRFESNGHDGVLDSVPSWIRDDPRYREFDTCKCRYSFNCPSPGLKFGHCAREKKYCCFNSKRFPGLSEGHHYPYYPGVPHKYGPNGFAPTSNYYGNRRPYNGGYQHPSFGDYYSGPYSGGYGHRNEFESLRPYGYDPEPDDYVIYGRSLGKNQTQTNEKPKMDESRK